MHRFFDLPRNQPAFPVNNFFLITAEVVFCFPTVFCDFILMIIAFRVHLNPTLKIV